jgi:predicted transglutaminase-like cysteine proteinase
MTQSFFDLRVLNAKVNLLPYKAELAEDWTPAVTESDCDSYATAKQWQLVHAYHWPEESTRLATCFVEPSANAEKAKRYHCVLLVDFEGITYVLDNRHSHPMEFDLLPYEWHKFWNHEMQAWEWAKDADRSIA